MVAANGSHKRIALLLLATAVTADLNQALGSVESHASSLQQEVGAWKSADGIQGALSLQEDFPALQSAISALSKQVESASGPDVEPQGIQSMAAAISNLLDALTQKAKDFGSVDAQQIVANDISGLVKPAEDIVSNIVNLVQTDCAKVSSLTDALGKFSKGFSSVNDAFGLTQAQFPATVTCEGGNNSNTASSMEASSMVMSGTEMQSASNTESSLVTESASSTVSAAYPFVAQSSLESGSTASVYSVNGAYTKKIALSAAIALPACVIALLC